LLLGGIAASGCTFLIDFRDQDAGTATDASVTSDEGAPEVDAGPLCQPDAADGTRWDTADNTARCCGGKPARTNTDEHCGACGIRCNTAQGQKCAKIVDQWYCVGCGSVGNDSCWSKCCSVQFYAAGACAASVCATGACNQAVCPKGTTCKSASGSSNYCGYDN
jgi:hypothetical protein